MTAPLITCADCQEARPRYARERCKRCYGRARRAGTLPPSPVRRPWTPAENAYLERAYLRGARACARHLGRTPEAVRHQLLRRGIRISREYRLTDLALALDTHPSTPRVWRRRGRLQTTGRGYLTEAALHVFFCTQGRLWRKYPCPDADWIDALLTDPRLRRAHGCTGIVTREEHTI